MHPMTVPIISTKLPARMTLFSRSLIIVLLLLHAAVGAEGKIYLVAAGISDYPGKRNDLALSAADARTIAWLYGENSATETMLLLNNNATAANITAAITSVFGKAGEGDIVVFFFSGHGVRGGFVAYDRVLSYEQVRNAMARSRSKNKMIFADACYSGRLRTWEGDDEQVEAAKRANVMLFLSSRSNEKSIENKRMKNGFFTTYLQKGLRGHADSNRDRTITARELFEYVHNGVAEISKGRQHPVMWGNFADDMPVMQW